MTRLQRRLTVGILAAVGGAIVGYYCAQQVIEEEEGVSWSLTMATDMTEEDMEILVAMHQFLNNGTVGIGYG